MLLGGSSRYDFDAIASGLELQESLKWLIVADLSAVLDAVEHGKE